MPTNVEILKDISDFFFGFFFVFVFVFKYPGYTMLKTNESLHNAQNTPPHSVRKFKSVKQPKSINIKLT